jgi:hypothetical protein
MNEQTDTARADQDTLCDAEGPIPNLPPLPIDPVTGRLLPMSDEELAYRRAVAIRAIKALGQLTDESDTDEVWEEVYRNIDAARPHRKLFQGMY